ncbi:hypothetical protein PDE_08463 [Penicillium oxalicum 114-2]|uniref:Uncharacterized protein n=1 Tax=Penicillium oxalicum (strain 114-2 / CGMCC 5302) TaxID=933388 RepID=S7ZXK2_PENO1|nr:hypothetical protein PDE_08463 [Penicillium oxalicum 114-2]
MYTRETVQDLMYMLSRQIEAAAPPFLIQSGGSADVQNTFHSTRITGTRDILKKLAAKTLALEDSPTDPIPFAADDHAFVQVSARSPPGASRIGKLLNVHPSVCLGRFGLIGLDFEH